MTMDVKCFATLAPFTPPGGVLDHRPGETVGELLDRLGVERAQAKMIFIDGRSAALEAPVPDGSRVGIFPAVAGG